MFHKNRLWSVGPVATPEELAEKLTGHTWCLCTGFYVEGHENYLFLNDATHEDGAGEWAVVKAKVGDRQGTQIESITFSWIDRPGEALDIVNRVLSGGFESGEHQRTPVPFEGSVVVATSVGDLRSLIGGGVPVAPMAVPVALRTEPCRGHTCRFCQ
jgi:hypothetical protein